MRQPSLLHAIRAVFNGFSQIFLQTHSGCGLLIVTTIAIYVPSLLPGALLGVLSGTLVAQLCRYRLRDIEAGLYGYNAALLGLLIVLVLGPSALALLLVVIGGGLSSLFQHYLLQIMRERGGLPGFTLPFVMLGWLSLGLAGIFDSLADPQLAEHRLDGREALGAMARGIGQVMFLGEPGAGVCLLAALLIADKRAGLWALCGSAVGVYSALLMGGPEPQAMAGLTGYNPALAALALSQMHRSALAPALGIALAVLCRLAFDHLGVPPLTMPFILACWVVALGARLNQRRLQAQTI